MVPIVVIAIIIASRLKIGFPDLVWSVRIAGSGFFVKRYFVVGKDYWIIYLNLVAACILALGYNLL